MERSDKSSFDWLIYADATLAGLAVLIPIPFLDSLIEYLFQRRAVRSIAGRHRLTLAPRIQRLLTRQRSSFSWTGCLLWPLMLILVLFKRLSRKILYFLTIKEATDQLSYHWHRAFLLNYLMSQGHLTEMASAQVARQALDHTLQNATLSPLYQTAQQITHDARDVWRIWRRAWQRETAETMAEINRLSVRARWEDSWAYLETLAQQYQQRYEQLQAEAQIVLHKREAQPIQYKSVEVETDVREEGHSSFQTQEATTPPATGAEGGRQDGPTPQSPTQTAPDDQQTETPL